MPAWLLAACRPVVPLLEASDVELDEAYLTARLAQLASSYLTITPTQPDYLSAAFFATLALAIDRTHVCARRILSQATLSGAHASDVFPFRPSATAGAAASAAVDASAFAPTSARSRGALTAPVPLVAEGSDHAAQAALHVLEHGTHATFRDPESASTYAEACRRLGRFREGEEALAWTLQSQPSSLDASSSRSPPDFPISHRSSPAEAQRLCQAASLALAGNRHGDAAYAYRSALNNHDRWCWSAWTGYCDAGAATTESLSPSSDSNSDKGRFSGASAFATLPGPPGHRAINFFPCDLDARHAELVTLEDELAKLKQPPPENTATAATAGPRPPLTTAGRTRSQAGATAAVIPNRTASTSTYVPFYCSTSCLCANHDVYFSRPNSASQRPGLQPPNGTGSTRSSGTTVYQRPGSRVTNGPTTTATSKRARSAASAPNTTMQTTTRMNAARTGSVAPSTDVRNGRPPSSASTGAKGEDHQAETTAVRRSTRIHGEASRGGTSTTRPTRARDPAGPSLATRSRTTPAPPAPGSTASTEPNTRPSLRSRPTSAASSAPTNASARSTRSTTVPTVSRRVSTRARQPSAAAATPAKPGDDDGTESCAMTAQARYESLLHLKEDLSHSLRQAVLEAKRWTRVDRAVADILTTLGEAYRSVRTYHARRTVWLLRSANMDVGVTMEQVLEPGESVEDLVGYKVLDPRILATPTVQILLGRAYHDLARYAESERHFALARRADPTVLGGMDIYALTLFHLHREVALSALAQECLLLDKASAVANLVAGNTFSLQREHGVALRFFRRAMSVAPGYAYAYTLAGYEALELGQRDDAKSFFRAAIRCDRRHWNAWFGLGQISLLEGHWAYADFHYSQAVEINSQNAVLWDLCGWVREMGDDSYAAMQCYSRALSLDSNMAMTLLKRGELQSAMGWPRDAHDDFLRACTLAPHEARIHILLAKSYMRLAGGHFAELEPPGADDDPDGGAAGGNEGEGQSLDAAGFVRRHTATGGAGGRRAKAIGEPSYVHNSGYERAIANHLAVAIDLDPRSIRTIKAMGEGVHAAMQSAAKRGGVFDPTGLTSLSMSLNDLHAPTSASDSASRLPVESSGTTRTGEARGSPAAQGHVPAYTPASGPRRFEVHSDTAPSEVRAERELHLPVPAESSGYGHAGYVGSPYSARLERDAADWSNASDPDEADQSMMEEDVEMV